MARPTDTDFDPFDFLGDDYKPEFDDEITDIDELWQFEDYDGDYIYEYHGTGDTGGATE